MAEKLSAIRPESFFRERARRANIPEALEILKRMGEGNSPMKGDELPDSERLFTRAAAARNPQGQLEQEKNPCRVKKAIVPAWRTKQRRTTTAWMESCRSWSPSPGALKCASPSNAAEPGRLS